MTSPSFERTEQYRLQQLAVRAALLRELLRLWPSLNPRRLNDTFPVWFAATVRVIALHRSYSAAAAARYVRQVRAEAGVPGAAPVVPVPEFPRVEAQKALTVTALKTVRQATGRAVPLQRASQLGFVNSSAAASRLVLDAGRQVVTGSVEADPEAVGWVRVTDGDPCAFCAMLASQGAVYKSRQTAEFKAHGACGCQPMPIFDRNAAVPDLNREFARLWRRSTRGLKGKEAFNAFRRAHEGR